jgi:hypothetical protein
MINVIDERRHCELAVDQNTGARFELPAGKEAAVRHTLPKVINKPQGLVIGDD